MGMNGGNMQKMMKQMQKMQKDMEKMQAEIGARTVEASVGGGVNLQNIKSPASGNGLARGALITGFPVLRILTI